MTIDHYRNFIAIAEAGTISAASKVLRIAQPALSTQLKSFEKEYGAQLMIRYPRHLELTSAGKILYEKAKNICAVEDVAKNEINDCISGVRGTLWLGMTVAYPDPYITDLLLSFNEKYPNVRYEIFENSSDEILNLLKNNIIEVGIVRTPRDISPIFHSYFDIEEQLVAVYHKKNPWLSPNWASIPISLLQKVPLSVSKGFRQKITNICMKAGFQPDFFSVCSSRVIALMWASRGISVSIVTAASMGEYERDDFCCRPIVGYDTSTHRSFTVLKNRPLSTVTKNFLRFIQEKAEQKKTL